MKTSLLCSLILLALLPAGCGLKSGRPNIADRPQRPDQLLDFPKLFAQNCSGCHGADGKLSPAPPLNDALFLAIISDMELTRVITEGRKNTLMPPFGREQGGNLTPVQVHALVKGLRANWGTKPFVTGPLPTYLQSNAGPKGDKAQGADTFIMACAVCHGENGKGGDIAGPLNDPVFLALVSDQVLRRIIITGRPDLGMPDFADKTERGDRFKPLTDQDISDLVALLASWRQPKLVPKESQATPKSGK